MAATLTPTAAPARTVPTSGGGRRVERVLTVAATVAMGLIAGFFYAYACSVMIGLDRTDDRTFVATMQSINATVRNAGFAPSFFGALVLSVAAAAVAVRRGSPARRPLIAGAVLYAGAFVVTMAVSVPLNDELAAAGAPDRIADLAAVRHDYEGPWVAWNLVRTLLSTGALVALVSALGRTGGALRRR
jgi:uncharacterized membrane protein